MFIIGKAANAEIEEMKKLDFDVEDVDVGHFDRALDPKLSADDTGYEPDRYDPDKLVAVFCDYDIIQECRDIMNNGG